MFVTFVMDNETLTRKGNHFQCDERGWHRKMMHNIDLYNAIPDPLSMD